MTDDNEGEVVGCLEISFVETIKILSLTTEDVGVQVWVSLLGSMMCLPLSVQVCIRLHTTYLFSCAIINKTKKTKE